LKPKNPGQKNANDIDSDSSDEESVSDKLSDEPMGSFVNPSFASFVNSSQTLGDEEIPFEVIFKNEALIKILG